MHASQIPTIRNVAGKSVRRSTQSSLLRKSALRKSTTLFSCIAALILVCTILLSCSKSSKKAPVQETGSGSGTTNGKVPLIGFSLDSLVVERWRRDVDSFTKAVHDLGGEVTLRVANQDANTQIAQVRELVNQGVDALVITPNDAEKLSDVCREAKRKGVPVMCYDRLVHKANVDLYISFDNEAVGRFQAEAVTKVVPKGNYVIVNGATTDNNSYMINRGFHSVLDPLVASREIQLVGEIWPSDWMSDEVKSRFEGLIKPGVQIDAVLCGNDMEAETVISVLSENRMIGKTKVTGQDAELSACQRIAEGTQFATIYKPIDTLALKAAGFAVMMARGEKIPSENRIDDGQNKVPYVALEPTLVTAANLDATVIKDGFHSREEVYRNVK
ncbi:MAG TPA: substrate-binding domain-containing protein [Spirochaetales bacterium]|nr:substrate-binding domain-containing protein [Spirochaetales bacterium]